jgi:phage baseplate assembly protein W
MEPTGVAFPFRIEGGGVRLSRGDQKIREDVRHLLAVRRGERVMRRRYGGGAQNALQDANDETRRALLKHEIEGALREFLPQVELAAPVAVSGSGSEITATLQYRISRDAFVEQLEIDALWKGTGG